MWQMQITTHLVDKQNIKLLSTSFANIDKVLKNLHCCNLKTLQYSDHFLSWHKNKILCKSEHFSGRYRRKREWVFFSEQSMKRSEEAAC